MDRKVILFGGSEDGRELSVPFNQSRYTVDKKSVITVYRETSFKTKNGKIIFSCNDKVLLI